MTTTDQLVPLCLHCGHHPDDHIDDRGPYAGFYCPDSGRRSEYEPHPDEDQRV